MLIIENSLRTMSIYYFTKHFLLFSLITKKTLNRIFLNAVIDPYISYET